VSRSSAQLAGVALAVGLLSACSFGSTGNPSAATTVPAAGSAASVPATTTAAETTTAAVAETPSAAPAPVVPTLPSVATDTPRPQRTDVVLSFVGWNTTTAAVEAGGYLSPVVEAGGTCTLALTKGSRTVTAVAPAQADASTTSCGNLAVPRTQLTPGTWMAVLRYSSRSTTGKSEPASVAVPQ
jgi:hypothetical protein